MNTRNFDKYKLEYNSLPFEPILEDIRQKKLVDIVEKLSISDILEVGCGRNSIFNKLEKFNSGVIVEPIQDFLSSNMSKLKNKKIVGFNQTLELYMQLEKIKVDFDLLILSSVLHEFEDLDLNLDLCHKLLKPGGYILCVVPNKYSLHRIIYNFGKSPNIFNAKTTTESRMQQKASFSLTDLERIFISKKFTTIDIFTWFVKPFPHFKMQDLVNSGVISGVEIEFLENISKELSNFGAEIFYLGKRND